jgi:hypothetical protein
MEAHPVNDLRRLAGLVALGLILAGCAGTASRMDMFPQHFGFRPDEPKVVDTDDACAEYLSYVDYTQKLMEAYHSRATQNRWWIYVAGIVGLGVGAASAGLGIAGAAAATIALLAVSGGFTAASFATIDNQDLAKIYTIAATRVDTAFKDADAQLRVSRDKTTRYDDKEACGRALVTLKQGLWEARTMLEQARTSTAVAALVRAREEQKVLADVIAGAQDADPTRVTLAADITEVTPTAMAKREATEITLKVVNIRLDRVAMADVKVLLGTRELELSTSPTPDGSDQTTWKVTFTAPAQPPNTSQTVYAPTLLVGKSKQRVVSQSGKTLTYPTQ